MYLKKAKGRHFKHLLNYTSCRLNHLQMAIFRNNNSTKLIMLYDSRHFKSNNVSNKRLFFKS